MTNFMRFRSYFGRPRTLAAIYGVAIALLCFVTAASLVGITRRYTERNNALTILENLRARALSYSSSADRASATNTDAEFLGGSSATVASALLLQRVTGAIAGAGGRVLSSEVDERPAQPKDAELKATIDFEIEQVDLQRLLYDLESGAPFLFVDQLIIHAKQLPDAADARLGIVMQVSGIWRGPQ
jgi:general secretion pathway protein M